MPSNTSKPLIPAEVLRKLRTDPLLDVDNTVITSAEWHAVRLALVANKPGDMSTETIVVLQGTSPFQTPFRAEDGKKWLHYAAERGDPCCALEFIHLGATIDAKDSRGYTPLRLGMNIMLAGSEVLEGRRCGVQWLAPTPDEDPRYAETMVHRVKWVCRLLIEQHADVNHTLASDTRSILDCACIARDWELIELLLRHGAEPWKQTADGRRIGRLGGKTLVECHAAGSKPYPPEYLCRCGTGKTYGKCCSKRGVVFDEYWDEKSQWIGGSETRKIFLHTDGSMDLDDIALLQENLRLISTRENSVDLGIVNAQDTRCVIRRYLEIMRKHLREIEAVVDPTFYYAMTNTDFIPIPQGRSASNTQQATEKAKDWNGLIDRYIELGTDPRPSLEIEQAAKINNYCGALHRKCEGVACGKLERRDLEKLNLCSKCKTAVYCGRECQASAWKRHKYACQAGASVQQMLASQVAVQKYMIPAMQQAAQEHVYGETTST
ncbi:hypothetical protein GLOTRDRAFT_128069 [Gloeophyllum trabeum ATCC 11539]|uniref:MYND-type domain-containing protein n=1 Tax=Gloeophyllum trabeum (strain ATCC 11539 / FP-39264 / Madison 617) TaxID=670483 RepID=S7Q9B3_GLOTA|nr:uncharacterized protein GLOTRDRAFT_128069 [Gloeophyllum trabeum ATCC 11539]EPQ56112.1 hypothetical protein GLOTRDRAFT_128069 [Gloeophyllum trabeum ATCC 11539]